MGYKKLHKELWLWLSENPEKRKMDWPGWKRNGGQVAEVFQDCFACETARIRKKADESSCEHCPLTFQKSNLDCLDGLYKDWIEETSRFLRRETALKIANLEWRE